jgi:glycosyltransferase involved in cell wall biosynthesis
MRTTAPTVWIVSELYYPEETSTGYLLTRIAEALAAAGHDVRAVCAQPTYSQRGARAPRRELRHGVRIERCWSTTLDKDRLPLRAINALSLALTIFVTTLARVARGDLVFVVTNPPLLPFVTYVAARLRGARVALIVHDIYPDALVAAGMMHDAAPLTRVARRMTRWLYRSVAYVVVLGRDMERLVREAIGARSTRVVVIPNWADLDDVAPSDRATNPVLAEHGLTDKFVLQYAGNMGRTHDVESVLRVAEALRDEPHFHFLVVGWGAKEDLVRRTIAERDLRNVTMLGRLPRSAQQDFLNACDAALITFVPGMAGVSVPSRMYNVMAVAKPIIAMADAHSELALVLREHGAGWVAAPRDWRALEAAVREAARDAAELRARGLRARRAATECFSFEQAAARYARLVARDLAQHGTAGRAQVVVEAGTSGT